jgi:hypothetical protein
MLDVLDLFYVSVAAIALAIVLFVRRAVRLTNASIANASRHVNLENSDVARRVAEEIRGREVPCARCGRQTFVLLGTGNRYKCRLCHFDFEGPPHIPTEITTD